MLLVRRAWFACSLAAATAGCLLFTDVDGLSGSNPPPAEAAPADAAEDVAADVAADVDAGAPDIGRGTGADGVLQVTGAVAPNAYHAVAAAVPAGARVLELTTVGALKKGKVVLVWQTAGLAPPPVGDQQQLIFGTNEPLGRAELTRVEGVEGSKVTLDRALSFPLLSSGAQLVEVPEHTDVIVEAAGALRAAPWDGRAGGIVALLATGTITNAGSIAADGAGFRGGRGLMTELLNDCAALEGTIGEGFAARGEGLSTTAYVADLQDGGALGGRGNVGNGGGGGNCHNAGGGGGGNGAAGGIGGRTYVSDGSRPVGGLGGVSVAGALDARLWLGGGGGAGHGERSSGETVASGGRGGGVVFLRARAISGDGSISASGADGEPSIGNGGAGGGAGGSIVLEVDDALVCSSARAHGGNGGEVNVSAGPGGGGAGGRIRVLAKSKACPASATGGAPGGGDAGLGATAGGPGLVE